MFQQNPLVSVVIPSKNRPDLVVATLASVFSQTYENFEVIVVDDGSDPPLAPLLKERFGNRVLCLRIDQSVGGAAARNHGARSAHGEYIAFLDDDDLWLPNKLDLQVDAFLKQGDDVGVIYCGFDFLHNEQIVYRDNKYHNPVDLRLAVLAGCPFGSPTPLIKKHYYDRVGGFDGELPSCQDWDLWIRLSKVCTFSPVKESLALYRVHGDQISTHLVNKIDGRKMILAKHYNDIKSHPRLLSAHYSRIGSLCVLADEHVQARDYFSKALANNMLDGGSFIHLVLQFLCKPLEKWLIQRVSVNAIDGIIVIH